MFSITTTGTGASNSIRLPGGGDWVLVVTWAGGAGDADLQCSYDGTNFVDVENSSESVVNITSNKAIRVSGSLYYRLNVNTHTSAATVNASQVEGLHSWN